MNKIILYLKLMRLHQPTGIWLLLWPCWWSIALTTQSHFPSLTLLGLFLLGAIVMRGAGCVINDIIDRKIDAQVVRTKNRPLASGALTLSDALILLAILCFIGLFVLVNLNIAAIIIGFLFFIPVCVYPFMKRWIAWPQIFLGLTFNAGAVVGWAAVSGWEIPLSALILYLSGIFWTLGYDTIYAHQDKKDDMRIGVKSTAVNMREKTKSYIYAFYLIEIMLLIVVGWLVFTVPPYVFYGGVGVAFGHLMWQVKSADLDNPMDCMNKFKSNVMFGWIVFFAIVGEKYIQHSL